MVTHFLFNIVKKAVCERFNPMLPEHMDAIGEDCATLADLVQLCKYETLEMYFLIHVILYLIISVKNFVTS